MISVDYWIGHENYNGWNYNHPNSAGGVGVLFNLRNTGSKTIKYATLYFIPYNNVGDAVMCETRLQSERGITYTGPLDSGRTARKIYLDCLWYNYSITSCKLTKVEIEFMDGTSETVSGSQVSRISGGSGGCYVATAVYGSYDCPEVWVLRRYRDYSLAKTWYGRAFIKTYYAISPTIVKWFGKTEWFKKLWKGKLDKLVDDLQKKGVENSPYEDIKW